MKECDHKWVDCDAKEWCLFQWCRVCGTTRTKCVAGKDEWRYEYPENYGERS